MVYLCAEASRVLGGWTLFRFFVGIERDGGGWNTHEHEVSWAQDFTGGENRDDRQFAGVSSFCHLGMSK